MYLPRDDEEVQQEAVKSREEFEVLSKEQKKRHPIGLILLAKKERIKQKMTVPFHFIVMMKRMHQKHEREREQEKSFRSDSLGEEGSLHEVHDEELSEKALK